MSKNPLSSLHKQYISSDRVEGTQVHGLDGVSLGKITRLQIDRESGKVASAFVLLHRHFSAVEHEVAWAELRFDFATNAYQTDIAKLDPVRPFVQSDRVEGMEMYDQDGTDMGTIKRMLIDKLSGHVDCAVVMHHGWFGLKSEEYRVSWNDLHFDAKLSGFRLRDSRALQPFKERH